VNHPIVTASAAKSALITHGVGYPVRSDPTYKKAHDAVMYGDEDWAVVYSSDGEYILFRAWRISPFSYAWQTSAMAAPAFHPYMNRT